MTNHRAVLPKQSGENQARAGVARFTEDWENLFFSRKNGFTTDMYLSIVRVTVRYTLDVIVVCKCRHYRTRRSLYAPSFWAGRELGEHL